LKTLEDVAISGINLMKMAVLPKATFTFNAMPIKIPMSLFVEKEK
jgi:hypothetical protein